MQEKNDSHAETSEIDIFYLLTFLSFILENPGILGSLNPDEEKEFIEMQMALESTKKNKVDQIGSTLRENLYGWNIFIPFSKYLKIDARKPTASKLVILIDHFLTELDVAFEKGDIEKSSESAETIFNVYRFIDQIEPGFRKGATKLAASSLINVMSSFSKDSSKNFGYDSFSGRLSFPQGFDGLLKKDLKKYDEIFKTEPAFESEIPKARELTGLYCYYQLVRQSDRTMFDIPEKLKSTDFSSNVMALELFESLAQKSDTFLTFVEKARKDPILSLSPIVKRTDQLAQITFENLANSFAMSCDDFCD